jgi:hypothetical protein
MSAIPSAAITWETPAQRNRLLDRWRHAVSVAFAEQPRCLRVAWALDHLFNLKTGFAYPSNPSWQRKQGAPRNVQKALEALEADGAIVRTITVQTGGQRWRAIYPATSVLMVAGTSTVDVGGHVHQADVHNLRRTPRLPKSEIERARLAAQITDKRERRVRGEQGGPSEEEPDLPSSA